MSGHDGADLVLSGFLLGDGLVDDAHDVGLLHDQEFFAIEFHLGARPLAEQDAIAGLHLEGDDLALLVAGPWTGSDDLTLHRLFLGGVGNDDPTHSLFLGIEATDHHPIVQRTKFHWILTNLVPAYEAGRLARCLACTLQVQAFWHSRRGSAKHLGRQVLVFKLLA
jgi:hypothetical protein